jgi:hypothetical protein
MKTIAYRDRTGGPLKEYVKPAKDHQERILSALKELKHVGNINIYLVRGRKIRKLSVHPL